MGINLSQPQLLALTGLVIDTVEANAPKPVSTDDIWRCFQARNAPLSMFNTAVKTAVGTGRVKLGPKHSLIGAN